MFEFTVHFQKGTRVGTRALRMEHVQAATAAEAVKKAKVLFPTARAEGFRLTKVDHFDEDTGRLVQDM